MKAKNTRYKKILVFSAFTLDFCAISLKCITTAALHKIIAVHTPETSCVCIDFFRDAGPGAVRATAGSFFVPSRFYPTGQYIFFKRADLGRSRAAYGHSDSCSPISSGLGRLPAAGMLLVR